MSPTFIVVITALIVLGLSLLAVTAWLLYRFTRKKKDSKADPLPTKRKRAAVSLPPVFEVPPQYSTTKVQSPIFPMEEQISISPDKERLLKDHPPHKLSLPDISGTQESHEMAKRDFRMGRSISLAQPTWRSTPDIAISQHSSSTPPDENSGAGSPKIVRAAGADTKRRRISVDVFQHLKAQGRKASMANMPPVLLEDPSLDSLPVAAAVHRTRNLHDSPRVSLDASSLTPIQSDSEDEDSAESDGTEVSEGTTQHIRKRIGRRRTSEPVTFKKAGKITFSTEYNSNHKKLEVHIHRAFDIAKRKAHDNIFPFVRMYLLPGKKGKQHTKVQKKTKEPVFNEKKTFSDLHEEDLKKHRLKLKLYNRDSVTKNELLGEADLALGSLNISQRETFSLDLTLMTIVESNGQIMVSLCHQATFSQLQVIIHKAKNLRKVGIMGTPDAYVSVLFCRDNGWEKKDTRTKRSTRHPVFNETFNFDVTTDSSLPLSTFSLVVTVTHRSLVGKDEILGHVIFSLESPQATSTEHWRSITSSPHRLEAEWHSLLDPEDL